MLALEAQIALIGSNGRRTMPIADFVTDPYSTTLGPAELIEAVEVPRRARPSAGAAARSCARPANMRNRWRSP
jgi:CO/xanthine dehydrogenase FAD-binding subunit